MAQSGRITWGEFEIPQAASTTFAKSGGVQSAGSVGGDKNYTTAKSGSIQSAGSVGASRVVSHVKSAGTDSPGSLGASQSSQVARDGGIAVGGVLSGSQVTGVLRAGGIVSGAQTGAQRLTAVSKNGGTASVGSIGADVAVSVPGAQKARITWAEFEIPAAQDTSFPKAGGVSSPGSVGAVGSATPIVFVKSGGITSSGHIGGDVLGGATPPEGPPPSPYAGGIPGRIVQPKPTRRRKRVAPVRRKTVAQQHEAIETHAERLLRRAELPEYLTEGAKKAYQNMQKFYGPLDGRRIFMKKAIEQGRGQTLVEKINDVYATGATVDTRKKLQTRIQTKRISQPDVKILSRIRQ